MVQTLFKKMDWLLFFFTLPILGAGLVTMSSFLPKDGMVDGHLFLKQLLWIGVSLLVFFIFSFIDFRFLRRTDVLVALFVFFSCILILLFFVGNTINGSKSWFSLGGFSFQPVDFMKVVVILVLAKYFSRRHVEIAHMRHIFISGLYAIIPFILVALQPDFGSAIIIFLIWLGVSIVAGISKKHLLLIFLVVMVATAGMWFFAFKPYQKERILNFIHPLSDIRGSGYNAYQSTIAVGSGQILGKGVGYGTQSRLSFLPEYETDFVFAAFSEEWGFVGSMLILILFGLVIWRIIVNSMVGATNFETLFGTGVAVLFMSHIFVNVGMNIGLLPVTGITLPLMSYGGSHLLAEFSALGILMGMRRYNRPAHRDDMKNEFLGI